MGAYFHGVLINACNFCSGVQLCRNGLAVIYFRPRGSFSANFSPLFVAFLQPETQSAINQSLPPPTHQCKVFRTMRGFFTNSWIVQVQCPWLFIETLTVRGTARIQRLRKQLTQNVLWKLSSPAAIC